MGSVDGLSLSRQLTEGPEATADMNSKTRLAFERTFLAHERTQLAWVRTSLALISFGFAIVKFYQLLHETQGDEAPPFGPRAVGMIMISIGLIALAAANLQHRRALKLLRAECDRLPASTTGAVAVVIMMLGIGSRQRGVVASGGNAGGAAMLIFDQ